MSTPLQAYHSRRFVLDGAFAVISGNGCFNQQLRQQLDALRVAVEQANWDEYQTARFGSNEHAKKSKPVKRSFYDYPLP